MAGSKGPVGGGSRLRGSDGGDGPDGDPRGRSDGGQRRGSDGSRPPRGADDGRHPAGGRHPGESGDRRYTGRTTGDPGALPAVAGVTFLQFDWDWVSRLPEIFREPAVVASFVFVIGIVIGLVVGRFNKRLLTAMGVPEAVEGTAFERTAQSLGTSTVTILARLSSWFIYAVSLIAAINIAQILRTQDFWLRVAGFIPQLFIASLVVVVGFVVADKAELLVSERLRGVKLPEVNVVPRLVKYSVLYVAFLIALGQIGVQTLALVALLTVYAFAVVLFAALALRDFLSSGAAGVYLLLNQPYGIGDEVEIGDKRGVVQGMDIVVTRVENDGKEFIIPNRKVVEEGVVRIRK